MNTTENDLIEYIKQLQDVENALKGFIERNIEQALIDPNQIVRNYAEDKSKKVDIILSKQKRRIRRK